MIGDKLVIDEYHYAAAKFVLEHLDELKPEVPYAISVSGESGGGKSEIAHVLMENFIEKGLKVIVLGQDDYFILPPHSNHQKRKEDISWVGTQEVKLELLNDHVKTLLESNNEVVKPLVHFAENKIGTEKVYGPFDIVIAEGTYTVMLDNVDIHAFINRDYKETKRHRLSRNRDQSLESNSDHELTFLENVLQIEHEIIREHIKLSEIVIPPPDELLTNKSAG